MNENVKKIQVSPIYYTIADAIGKGYTTVSCQGSSRSAKTYSILIYLVLHLLKTPNTRLSIVRATLPSLKGSVFIDFKEILYKLGVFDEKNLNKSDLIYHFDNGSWVEFFSTDSEQKIRGRKRDILFCNEVNELKFIEWQQLKMRTTQFSIIDYNPSFTDEHWLMDVNKDSRTFHFISTYKDNPFLEQTIIDEIESLQDKNKSLWQVYGLGLQAIIEGLVFDKFNIVDEIPEHVKKRFYGLDFGYTQDPTAIGEVGISQDKKEIWIDEHCYRTHMLTKDIIAELKRIDPRQRPIWSESADPRLIDEIHNAGFNIHPVKKFKGSVEAGIDTMKGLTINVTKRSSNMIKEFKNYTYIQDKNGKWLNEPIDSFNHLIDGVRYVVLSEITGIGQPQNLYNVLGQFA